MIRTLKRAVSTSRYYFVEERWTTNYMALVRYYATLESERGDAAASAAVELLSMIESEGFGDGVPPLQALLWCRESPRMRAPDSQECCYPHRHPIRKKGNAWWGHVAASA